MRGSVNSRSVRVKNLISYPFKMSIILIGRRERRTTSVTAEQIPGIIKLFRVFFLKNGPDREWKNIISIKTIEPGSKIEFSLEPIASKKERKERKR